MNEEEKLQRLLRLKRHEQPPEGFAEEFLEKFQRRQRTELLRRSALSIFGERLAAWMEGLRRPAVVWSAAGIYGAVLVTLWLLPRPAPQNPVTMIVGTETTYAPAVNYTPGQPQATPVGTDIAVPGKRRTTGQEQDKEAVIGPKEKSEPAAPPLRDF